MSKYIDNICKHCGCEIANALIKRDDASWYHVNHVPGKMYECTCGCKLPRPEKIR